MDITNNIINNNIDSSRLIKEFDNNDINEDSLDLKFPKRTIIDISTDTFIKIIFKENIHYYLFLNYVNTLDIYLNYYGNIDMINDNFKPLNNNEYVELFFKGGNVMNYHFSKIVTNEKLKDLFSKYFKKSDFDFSVNIQTITDNRFNLLKKYIYPLIISFLKKTTNLFNNYLSEVLDDKVSINKIDTIFIKNFRDENNNYDFKIILDTIKDIINLPDFDFFKKIVSEYIISYGINKIPKIIDIIEINRYIRILFDNNKIIQLKINGVNKIIFNKNTIENINNIIDNYNYHIVNSFIEKYNQFYSSSKYHACILYPYYKYLITPISEHEYEYNKLINEIILYNFQILKNYNFYTKEKLNEMKNVISKSIVELQDIYYEINNDNPPLNYEISDTNAYNRYKVISKSPEIIINTRNDFISYNDYNTINGIVVKDYGNFYDDDNEKIDNNIHYISVNYLIKNVLQNRQTLDFDLFRIKFNLETIKSIEKMV